MKKRDRTILVALANTHAGNKLGLMSPRVVLADETPDGDKTPYMPELTAPQKYLWCLYDSHVRKVGEIAGKDRICVLHIGALTQDVKNVSSLVSTRIPDQITIALENLRPWCEMKGVSHIRFAGRTSSHSFGESTSYIIINNTLNSEFKDKDIDICGHSLLDVSGVEIEYGHFGPYPGSHLWTKRNVARDYLRDLLLNEIIQGNKPPGLVLRADYHMAVQEYLSLNGFSSWFNILPSCSMLGLYTRSATGHVNSVTTGLNVYEIIGGKIEKVHLLHSRKDVRPIIRV